jgi:riboflavin-specific deaminase-like protein
MRALTPAALDEDDLLRLYDDGERRAPGDRPWVVVNMIASVDGATSVDGVTAGLGDRTDRAVFLHLRTIADAILVGGSTVRAERYGPVRIAPEVQAARRARGQQPRPPVAVVSRRLRFDWSSALFASSDPPAILVVAERVDPEELEVARRHADILFAGEEEVDLTAALVALAGRGAGIVLCEGGPTLNAAMLAGGLIDELCLTLAPILVGGVGPGIIAGAGLPPARDLRLVHAVEKDEYLFLRYRRSGS